MGITCAQHKNSSQINKINKLTEGIERKVLWSQLVNLLF